MNIFTSYCRALQKEKFYNTFNNKTYKHNKHSWNLRYLEFGSFDTSGSSYWIHHLKFLNRVQIRDQRTQKPLSTDDHLNQVTLCLGPPYWISKFCAQIRNKRPQNPPSREFNPKEVTFSILIRHFEFLNFELRFVISDLDGPRVPSFVHIWLLLYFRSPYWIRHF